MYYSGYTLDLYCDKCMGSKWGDDLADWDSKMIRQVSVDGPNCYAIARRKARSMGFTLKRDGGCICPKCK